MKKRHLFILIGSLLSVGTYAIEETQIINDNVVYKIENKESNLLLKEIGINTQFKNIDGEKENIVTFLNNEKLNTLSFKNAKEVLPLNGTFVVKKKDGVYINDIKLKGTNEKTEFSLNPNNNPQERFIILLNKDISIYYPVYNHYKDIDLNINKEVMQYINTKQKEQISLEEVKKIMNDSIVVLTETNDSATGTANVNIEISKLPKDIIQSEVLNISFSFKTDINNDDNIIISYGEGYYPYSDPESAADEVLLPKMTLDKYSGEVIEFEDSEYKIENNTLYKQETCLQGLNKCFKNKNWIAIYQNNLPNKNIVKAFVKNDTIYMLYETGQLDVFNVNTNTVEDRLFNIVDITDNTLIKAFAKGMKQDIASLSNVNFNDIKIAERNELTTAYDLDIVNVPNYDEMFSFYVDNYPIYDVEYFGNDVKEYLKK